MEKDVDDAVPVEVADPERSAVVDVVPEPHIELAPTLGEYALRVHVDQSGDGHVMPGDLVSTARHAVRPVPGSVEIDVPVTPLPDTDPPAGGG